MAYASASDVAALAQPVLAGSTDFPVTAQTNRLVPTLAQVESWLSSGCAILEGTIESMGYSVPVGSTLSLYGELKFLNALYAAAWAELSAITGTVEPRARTRGQVLMDYFKMGLQDLKERDLEEVGLTQEQVNNAYIYVGGLEVSDKQDNESDTDIVQPRIARGMFKFPGANSPDSYPIVDDDD